MRRDPARLLAALAVGLGLAAVVPGAAAAPPRPARAKPAPAPAAPPAPGQPAAPAAPAATPAPGSQPAAAEDPPGTAYPPGFGTLPPLGLERAYQPPRVQRLPLACGGELWVVPDHTLPLLTVRVVMPGAGSAADPPGKGGLADYTADLLLEGGAGDLSGLKLAERLEGMGSQLAAWAEIDAAFLEVSMLARNRGDTLALLGSVVSTPRFDAADARRVLEDRRTAVLLRRDEPGAVAHLVLRAALQGEGSPYGHPPLGTLASLARLGGEEARAFHRERWAPGRLIVVAAGDVEPEELRALLDAGLGVWRGAGSPVAWPKARTAPAAAARLLVVDRKDAEQANVLLGVIGVPRSDPRAFALEVATTLLGGTFSSRLSHRLREELGLTYGISAVAGYQRVTGIVAIDSALFTPRTSEGLREALRLVGELGRGPVPEAERLAVVENLVRSLPQAFATSEAVVDAFADLAAAGLPPGWFDGYAAQVRAVTGDDLRRVAHELLDPGRLVVVVIGPLATIGADLARLGLGRPLELDADGAPVRR